jgi:hypothetical protein
MLHLLCLGVAFAVPQQLTQQGRLLDSTGSPIEGEHVLTFHVYDNAVSGNFLWGESLTITFNNGYYSATLGSDAGNPLYQDLWEENSIYLSIQVDSDSPLQPRRRILANPYALKSDVATNVEGGTVNATEISINGSVVLDSSGSFIGQSSPEWSSIQNIPSGFSDGVDNDSDSLADISCPSDDMILSYTGGTWTCGYDDVLDSADIIATVEDEILNLQDGSQMAGVDIATTDDLTWESINDRPNGLDDGDDDALSDISCGAGSILVYDTVSSSWGCGTDQDTTLTESEVRTMMESATALSLDLAATSKVDGADILTSDSTLNVDWENINNRPSGLDDGDDVTNALDDLGCTEGQIPMKGASGWECKEFSSVLDNDGDNSLQWNDCDDNDSSVGDQATDADCDGTRTVDDCDDSNANITTQGTGGNADCASTSCKKIKDDGYGSSDGMYYIDPNNTGSAYEVYCDMTTDGGGWTFVANISDSGSDVWSQLMPSSDTGLWDSTDTYGAFSLSDDYKSQAYMDVLATDILIKEAETNVLFTSSCFSEQNFQSFISALGWNAGGSDSNWSDSTGAHLCDFEHFGYNDTVLKASSHSGSDRVIGFKWGEADGTQDGNKDRTMITTNFANGSNHHVDSPTGLGGFTSYSGSQNSEDANECTGDGPDQCSNGTQNYQIYVRN